MPAWSLFQKVKDCARDMHTSKYKSCWSMPVASKNNTIDNSPSHRGEAVGSAFFSKLPSRQARVAINENLWNTQRFSSCIVRLAGVELWAISVYCFANRFKEGIRPNDLLIASLVSVIEEVGLPYIVAMDLNKPLVKFPAHKAFSIKTVVPLKPSSAIAVGLVVIFLLLVLVPHKIILRSCILFLLIRSMVCQSIRLACVRRYLSISIQQHCMKTR